MNLTISDILHLFDKPFFELISEAHKIHSAHFQKQEIELCALINIKTGACPEDCGFCNQSAHFKTGLKREALMDLEAVLKKAQDLKKLGVKRLCLGAAWRSPPKKDFPKVIEMIKAIRNMEFETCVTLGFLDDEQAQDLKVAGLDYYNHNIETSPDYYSEIVTTHSFQQRIDTVNTVANAGIKVCCGGIVGLGENLKDRAQFLLELRKLPTAPRSIPINRMIHFDKTPLGQIDKMDIFEFVKTIAVARILFPESMIRLSGGRLELSESDHALCFYAGANSIFVGDSLLTADNKSFMSDLSLMKQLDLKPIRPTYHQSA